MDILLLLYETLGPFGVSVTWKNNLPVFLPQDQDQEVKMDDGGRDDYLDPIFPGLREGWLHASRG